MVSLEQIKLLESKVTNTIAYLKKVTEENRLLKEKLVSGQERIDELEAQAGQFRQEQSRIEDGILSALERLNQFEDAVGSLIANERKLPEEKTSGGGVSKEGRQPAGTLEKAEQDAAKAAPGKKEPAREDAPDFSPPEGKNQNKGSGELEIF